MNYHDIEHASMMNGEGLRVCLFCSGCHFHCKGCQNQQTWDFKSGIPFDEKAEEELFNELSKDYISGITFLGGEPLAKENRKETLRLILKSRKLYPMKNIWVYTGYTYDEVINDKELLEIYNNIDVLCEGRFIQKLADPKYPYLGSLNQHLIDVRETKINGYKTVLKIEEEYLKNKILNNQI